MRSKRHIYLTLDARNTWHFLDEDEIQEGSTRGVLLNSRVMKSDLNNISISPKGEGVGITSIAIQCLNGKVCRLTPCFNSQHFLLRTGPGGPKRQRIDRASS